jgi:hypothetical protein
VAGSEIHAGASGGRRARPVSSVDNPPRSGTSHVKTRPGSAAYAEGPGNESHRSRMAPGLTRVRHQLCPHGRSRSRRCRRSEDERPGASKVLDPDDRDHLVAHDLSPGLPGPTFGWHAPLEDALWKPFGAIRPVLALAGLSPGAPIQGRYGSALCRRDARIVEATAFGDSWPLSFKRGTARGCPG